MSSFSDIPLHPQQQRAQYSNDSSHGNVRLNIRDANLLSLMVSLSYVRILINSGKDKYPILKQEAAKKAGRI